MRRLNKAQIRTPLTVLTVLTVCVFACVCVLQHGTLCHCDGSRPEQRREEEEEGGGGKREAMNITREKSETKGFIAAVFLILV